mmetsp:Transcript_4513/g.10643  ORF Transcript_4513/g.10643 Transcript_4513/m.10643 type:complete len:303 (-) Transcript_4513:102-1010(-)
MDDDAPLSALAKPLKLDDDTPLASLADIGTPRPSPKAGAKANGGSIAGGNSKALPPKASPSKVAAKGAGKGKLKGAVESSSSSSSSDSDDQSGSRSGEKAATPRKAAPAPPSKKAKMKLLRQQQEQQDLPEEGLAEDGGGAVKKRDRSQKEQVVADLLCRWWYALPDWPPAEEELYQAELAKRKLRKVSIQEWEWVPEEDSSGRRKVYELSQFRGLFRNSSGDLVDLRPKETCPCYTNFMKKDLTGLYDLLVVALENQLKDLKNSKYNEVELEQHLRAQLTSVRDKAYKASQLSGLKRRKST